RVAKAFRGKFRGRRGRPRCAMGPQAMSTRRSVSNCALPRLPAALHTSRDPIRTISGTGTPVHADIIALGDFKPGTAVNRDGPCKTASVSLTEVISWALRRASRLLLVANLLNVLAEPRRLLR